MYAKQQVSPHLFYTFQKEMQCFFVNRNSGRSSVRKICFLCEKCLLYKLLQTSLTYK